MVLNEKSIDKFRENSDSVFWNWLLDLIFKISRWKSFIAFVLFLAFFEYLFEVFLHIIYCPINNNKKKPLHTLISWLLTPTYLLKCGHECLVEKMGKISLWCTNCIKRWKKSCFFVDLSWCNRRCTLRNCLVPGHYQHFAFNFRRVNNIRTAEIRLERTVN